MENKPIDEKENADENANRDEDDQEVDQETEKKIGFKNQKPSHAGAGDADENWKKVDSIVSAAKDVYESEKSSFREVIESMIATLEDLLASEDGSGNLGGLYGGPQMDIPAEPEPKPGEETE